MWERSLTNVLEMRSEATLPFSRQKRALLKLLWYVTMVDATNCKRATSKK